MTLAADTPILLAKDKGFCMSRQNGNVIFILLITIALFAALTYAVVGSDRGSQPSMTLEENLIAAKEITDYAHGVDEAAQIVLLNGASFADLSFQNTVVAGYTHGTATTQVFDMTSGGKATYIAPKTDWLDSAQSAQTYYGQWYFPANVCVPAVGAGAGACNTDSLDNEDVVMILPYVTQGICTAINKKLNVALCGTDACADVGALWPAADTKFTGTFTDSAAIASAGSEYTGKTEGCIEGSGTAAQPAATYFYYRVLGAR